MTDWLSITRGDAPLLLSMPHSGTGLRDSRRGWCRHGWRARDADWWIPRLYSFAITLGATIVRTTLSRTVIDVNRDPSGQPLYPGLAATGLCPITTFDGEPLYLPGQEPAAQEIADRRTRYFDPYHAALREESDRLLRRYRRIVVYDCHSIRSGIPRLFEGELPELNIGTHNGRSCDPALGKAVEEVCAASGFSYVLNGRFQGGHITRSLGNPGRGLHAVQMELACRSYLREPGGPITPDNWPAAYDFTYAAPLRQVLERMLQQCLAWANGPP